MATTLISRKVRGSVSSSACDKRTPHHELKIIQGSIELLKSDVATAEVKRLIAKRVRDEKCFAWNHLELEFDSAKKDADESQLMTEFLAEDVETLRNEIVTQKWTSRLAAQSQDRIKKLGSILEEKKVLLEFAKERESTMKVRLEKCMTKDWKPCVGGGDGEAVDTFRAENDEVQKISSQYEDECQERESLEVEINFMTSRLVELRQNEASVSSGLKLCQLDLELKERQLRAAHAKTKNLLERKECKKADCTISKIACEQAELDFTQAEENVRTLKKLLRMKIGERAKLDEKVERKDKIEDWKRFSAKVKEALPEVPITEQYPLSDPAMVQFLQSLTKSSSTVSASTTTPFWTDEVENLMINFKERFGSDYKISSGSEIVADENKTQLEPPSLRFYQPPQTPLAMTTLKDFTSGKRRSKTSFPFALESIHRNSAVVDSCRTISNFWLKFSDALAYGVSTYPKTVVANGVMYRIRDGRSEPEKLFGPLSHDVWRRHNHERYHFSMSPGNGLIRPRFLRPTISATFLKE